MEEVFDLSNPLNWGCKLNIHKTPLTSSLILFNIQYWSREEWRNNEPELSEVMRMKLDQIFQLILRVKEKDDFTPPCPVHFRKSFKAFIKPQASVTIKI